jgi:hypothetical protein
MRKQYMIGIGIALSVGVLLGTSTRSVYAAFFDRDKLAHALALRFHLNEQEVSNFLAAFQYNPDQIVAPAATPTPIPVTQNGVTYQYDSYTDRYFVGTDLASVQRQNNLAFVATALQTRVNQGKMTPELRRKIINKLAVVMEESPSSAQFSQMSTREQNAAITSFRKTMDAWLRGLGMTLADLRDWTGKGNKFLMGIYLE